jgi:5'-methylthioadenosine phosphorylase
MNPDSSSSPLIAIIGGSGLYHMDTLRDVEEKTMTTPFGAPSDAVRIGTLSGRRIAFLPRHGRHHSLLPSEIPHRANIHALKQLGVRWIISVSAVGSLREDIHPGDLVFPDQFADRTKRSAEHTFFGKGIVAHVSFGSPVCRQLQTLLFQSATTMGARCHWGGTYVNMEGPAFSTRAESEMHRQMGFAIVGMTNLAEAKLAREAEISYATLAAVTDYDCWHSFEAEVNVGDVIKVLHANTELARKTVAHTAGQIPLQASTPCHRALETALITPREHWPADTVRALEPILRRFL